MLVRLFDKLSRAPRGRRLKTKLSKKAAAEVRDEWIKKKRPESWLVPLKR